jgi:hypothetical protein
MPLSEARIRELAVYVGEAHAAKAVRVADPFDVDELIRDLDDVSDLTRDEYDRLCPAIAEMLRGALVAASVTLAQADGAPPVGTENT